jgi:hypothetical protein
MRVVLGLVATLIALIVIVPAIRYGTLDPCRMLAKDMADESYARLAGVIGATPGKTPEAAETMGRMATSQYSQGECIMRLKDRWLGLEKPEQ